MPIPKGSSCCWKTAEGTAKRFIQTQRSYTSWTGQLITINPAGEEDSLKKEIRKILKGNSKDFDNGVYRLKDIYVTRCNSNKICVY